MSHDWKDAVRPGLGDDLTEGFAYKELKLINHHAPELVPRRFWPCEGERGQLSHQEITKIDALLAGEGIAEIDEDDLAVIQPGLEGNRRAVLPQRPVHHLGPQHSPQPIARGESQGAFVVGTHLFKLGPEFKGGIEAGPR